MLVPHGLSIEVGAGRLLPRVWVRGVDEIDERQAGEADLITAPDLAVVVEAMDFEGLV